MRYRYYIDILIPEEERSSDVLLILDLLRYAQIVQVEDKFIRIPCPHGIGRPLVWQEQNIANMASFGIKAEARRGQLL
jgi:hypothetical protein